MALASYFNWDNNLQANMNLETSFFHEATPEEEVLVAPEYYFNYNNHQTLLPYSCNQLDPNMSYLDPYSSNFVYPHEPVPPYDPFMYDNHYDYDNLLPCPKRRKCMSYENHYDYDNLLPCPKRRKCMSYENHHDYDNLLSCPKRRKCMSYDQNLMMPKDLIVPRNDSFLFNWNNVVVPSVPEFYNNDFAGNVKIVAAPVEEVGGRKKEEEEEAMGPTTVSVQSVAARERRRKITEKTQELGKLVPGGSKMNTADMLHAAAKYVNYLKAQVSMLQLMDTLQQGDEVFTEDEEMKKLLACPVIEEKIYMEEKCFVPKEFVTNLTNHKDIKSKPSILKDLKQFISADTENKEQ